MQNCSTYITLFMMMYEYRPIDYLHSFCFFCSCVQGTCQSVLFYLVGWLFLQVACPSVLFVLFFQEFCPSVLFFTGIMPRCLFCFVFTGNMLKCFALFCFCRKHAKVTLKENADRREAIKGTMSQTMVKKKKKEKKKKHNVLMTLAMMVMMMYLLMM